MIPRSSITTQANRTTILTQQPSSECLNPSSSSNCLTSSISSTIYSQLRPPQRRLQPRRRPQQRKKRLKQQLFTKLTMTMQSPGAWYMDCLPSRIIIRKFHVRFTFYYFLLFQSLVYFSDQLFSPPKLLILSNWTLILLFLLYSVCCSWIKLSIEMLCMTEKFSKW